MDSCYNRRVWRWAKEKCKAWSQPRRASALLPRLKLVGMPAMSQRAAVVGMGDRRVDGVGV